MDFLDYFVFNFWNWSENCFIGFMLFMLVNMLRVEYFLFCFVLYRKSVFLLFFVVCWLVNCVRKSFVVWYDLGNVYINCILENCSKEKWFFVLEIGKI